MWYEAIILGIKAFYALSGLESLFSSWQQRRAGAASQRASDEAALSKVNKAEAQAAENAPATKQELEESLQKGEL